jgi:hypothetical protein
MSIFEATSLVLKDITNSRAMSTAHHLESGLNNKKSTNKAVRCDNPSKPDNRQYSDGNK